MFRVRYYQVIIIVKRCGLCLVARNAARDTTSGREFDFGLLFGSSITRISTWSMISTGSDTAFLFLQNGADLRIQRRWSLLYDMTTLDKALGMIFYLSGPIVSLP